MPQAEKRLISQGLKYMVAATFFFSLMSLLVKITGRGLPPQEIVMIRSAVLLLIVSFTIHRQQINPWGINKKLLLLRGLLGLIAVNCFYIALVRLPLAEATVIMFTNPVFTALIAAVMLAELIGKKDIGLMAISLAGVVLVVQPAMLFGKVGAGLDTIGVTMGLISAVLSAAAWVTIRKLSQTEPVVVIVFYFAIIATLGSVPLVMMNPVWPTAVEWLLLTGIGVTTHFGQLNLTRGLKLEKAGRAASVTYLQMIFAALWGMLIFNEVPSLLSIAGAILIVGSTLMLGRMPARPSI